MTKRNIERLKAAEQALIAASCKDDDVSRSADKAAAELQAARYESELLHRRWQDEQRKARENTIRRTITLRGVRFLLPNPSRYLAYVAIP